MITKLIKKGTLIAFTALVISLSLHPGLQPSKAYAQTTPPAIYVSTTGNDQTGDGSQTNPFATITRAQTAVRAINGNMGNDIYVYVAAGTYYLNNGITFTEMDSGTNGYNVIYKNKDSLDSATFVGGVKVTSSWTPVTQNQAGNTWVDNDLPVSSYGSVYKTNIGAGLNRNVPGILSSNTNNGVDVNHVGINTLYVNDERAVLARYANKYVIPGFPSANSNYLSYLTSGSNMTQLTNNGHLPTNIQQGLRDAYNHGDLNASIFLWDGGAVQWTTDTIPIGSINTSGANDILYFLTDANNPQLYIPKYSPGWQGSNGLYFIQGNISMLDQPGEFYYDNSTGDLYYYPLPGSGPIQNQNIVYPTTETLISIQGASRTNEAHNITFDGLKFEDTSFPDYYTYAWNWGDQPGGIGWYPLQALGSMQPSYSETAERVDYEVGLFRLSNTNHITITNSHLKNSGMFGVVMYLANDHNVISNSLIEDMGHGGVQLEGGYPGTGGANVSGGYTGSDPDMDGKAAPISYNNTNTVTNSIIHDVGQLVGQTAGVIVFNSGNNTFTHLDIYNSPRRAIWVQAGYNRNPSTPAPIGAPSGSSTGIVGTADDAGYNPVTDMYAYNNHFAYIYFYNCEQASGDDGAYFSDWLYGFSGSDLTNYRPNYMNQIVIDKIGAFPGITEWVAPNNFNLDMGNKGYIISNVKSVNPQHYNKEFSNGPWYTITNSNFYYSAGTPGGDGYDTFDDSQMQYGQIGVDSTFPSAFSSAIPITAVTTPTNIYFKDEFNWIDPTKWSYSGPAPMLSSLFASEGGMAGNMSSLDLNDSGSAGKTVLYRQFTSGLNKVVSVKVFDRQNSSYCDYSGYGYNYQFTGKTFARADDGTAANELALGIDPSTNASYYMMKVGGTETATTVLRTYGWHTLMFDYSASGTVKLSIDGTIVNTLTGSQYNSFSYVSLGSADGTGENYFDQLYIYGGIAASPNIAAPLPIPGNIAPGATVTASSANSAYPASNAIDGDPSTEWVSNETNPGLQLSWNAPQIVNKITLFDRSNLSDWAPGGTLTFSDGSSFNVSGIPNNGTPFTIAFPAKVVTWIDFQVAGGQGSNVGLAEVVVYGQPAANISPNATATASTSFNNAAYLPSKAIDGSVSTEWASAGELNPWIQLNWAAPQSIGAITFNDRANSTDWAPGGTLIFSDGSTKVVSGIPNNGSAYTITFPTKTVSWVKFQVSGGSGSNVGLAEFGVYGQPASNVSLTGTATASSTFSSNYSASKATDGNVSTEWASSGELNPWLQLNWTVPQNIGGITFNDRASSVDWAPGGTLTFSDGSTMSVNGIPNNGGPYTITFPTKTVSWVKFQVSGGSGSNVGLAEFDVYGQPASNVSLTGTATASSAFSGNYSASKATDGIASTEWASSGELNPWIQLSWAVPQNIGGITLNDRANSTDWAPGGTLTFSDGSTMSVNGIANNGSPYTITFPTKTVSWVKFQVSGGSGSNVGLAEMQLYSAETPLSSTSTTNLALNKTATASSQFSTSYTPAMAVDGNTSTRWAQGGGLPDPSWLEVDLGTNKTVNQINTMFQFSSGYKYKIEYSTDNINWTLYVDKTTNYTAQQTVMDMNTVTARYVRTTITASSGNGGSIYEFGVYGN